MAFPNFQFRVAKLTVSLGRISGKTTKRSQHQLLHLTPKQIQNQFNVDHSSNGLVLLPPPFPHSYTATALQKKRKSPLFKSNTFRSNFKLVNILIKRAIMSSRPQNIGIKAIDLYFPSQCVAQSELEKFDGVSEGKYTIGLGQTKMSFCDDREGIESPVSSKTKLISP